MTLSERSKPFVEQGFQLNAVRHVAADEQGAAGIRHRRQKLGNLIVDTLLYLRQRQLHDVVRLLYELMLKVDIGYVVNRLRRTIGDR